jgi:hypothetical protein
MSAIWLITRPSIRGRYPWVARRISPNANGRSGPALRAAVEVRGNGRRRAVQSMHAHIPDQPPVDIHARIEHQPVLGLLKLMQEKHNQDA